jgi:hypothetical protein
MKEMNTMHELLMPELVELQMAERRAEADAHRLAKSGTEVRTTRRFAWTGFKWLDRRPGQTQRPVKAI